MEQGWDFAGIRWQSLDAAVGCVKTFILTINERG